MLLSMTGYGQARGTYENKNITVEVKSLNSKYLDVKTKPPQEYSHKEMEIRKFIAEKAKRGKIDVIIEINYDEGGPSFLLNHTLFKAYYRELSGLMMELGGEMRDSIQAIMRIPEVTTAGVVTIDDAEWTFVVSLLDKATDALYQFRLDEGKTLEADFQLRVNNISGLLEAITPHEAPRVTKLRERFHQSLGEWIDKSTIDDNRLEQELIYYIEKLDITEEKIRLAQHCSYFLEQLNNDDKLKGRKLSFITQEMGREINTIGAKANSADIQRLVVQMKDELEKIKEQLANAL